MKTNICLSLGLPEFTILNQQEQENRILLRVMIHTGPERCPHCDFTMVKHHDQRVRKVRDLDLLGKSLFLLIQVRRWYCLKCQAFFSEELPSVPPGKHQTYRFREHIFKMCQDTTISYVSRQIHMSYKTVERIYYDLAAPSIPDIELSADHAFNQIRKNTQHQVKGLKKGRYALLKRPFRLTEKQFQKLDHYHQESQELAHAYYLKEWFYDFYEQPNIDEARNFLVNGSKPQHPALLNLIMNWSKRLNPGKCIF